MDRIGRLSKRPAPGKLIRRLFATLRLGGMRLPAFFRFAVEGGFQFPGKRLHGPPAG
jgi:hypothetical protein